MRVHDGNQWVTIEEKPITGSQVPVPPAADGDGTIFVSLPSFRDGKRCAETIKSIFDNASHPEKVVVGIIEQNAPDDTFCLEAYCSLFGVKNIDKKKIRKDMTKIVANPQREKCPHFDSIRQVSVHNIAAKGPLAARALTRKIVGNEEYCMQIDAHTVFAKDWDRVAMDDWKKTGNEFAILSTVPADKQKQSDYESWTGDKKGQVPRPCLAKFNRDNGIPEFLSPADGIAADLTKPLLSHAWSAAFSFSKCHLEETAPYDPFLPYVMGPEQFSRLARFWTRGYDVYTPTTNIVYHDYSPNPDGHGTSEWMARRKQRLKLESLDRIKSFLQMPGSDTNENTLANMGIYGLGKRRSLQQLEEFVGIDLATKVGNAKDKKCGSQEWVSYDTNISPMENLFPKATDLDPQPEFPLRTKTVFYHEMDMPPGIPELLINDPLSHPQLKMEMPTHAEAGGPPVTILFILWVFGLIVWFMVFVNKGEGSGKPRRRKKAGAAGYKDV